MQPQTLTSWWSVRMIRLKLNKFQWLQMLSPLESKRLWLQTKRTTLSMIRCHRQAEQTRCTNQWSVMIKIQNIWNNLQNQNYESMKKMMICMILQIIRWKMLLSQNCQTSFLLDLPEKVTSQVKWSFIIMSIPTKISWEPTTWEDL